MALFSPDRILTNLKYRKTQFLNQYGTKCTLLRTLTEFGPEYGLTEGSEQQVQFAIKYPQPGQYSSYILRCINGEYVKVAKEDISIP